MAGLIYAINGAVMVATVAAYHVAMCYPALPWLLLCTFELGRRRSAAFGLGFWLAFNVLNGIQYFTVYNILVAGVVWLRALRLRGWMNEQCVSYGFAAGRRRLPGSGGLAHRHDRGGLPRLPSALSQRLGFEPLDPALRSARPAEVRRFAPDGGPGVLGIDLLHRPDRAGAEPS